MLGRLFRRTSLDAPPPAVGESEHQLRRALGPLQLTLLGVGLSLELTIWSRDIVLCTDGPAEIDAEGLARLESALDELR